MEAVTIPVFAKVRIGHFAEAQILEAIGVDMIDESEGESRSFWNVFEATEIGNPCNKITEQKNMKICSKQ